MAIASIILGALGFCTVVTGLVGIVLGVVALRQIGASNGRLTGQPAAIVGIVVSAISVLAIPVVAAILFPVVSQARNRARSAACVSRVKQLSLGVLMYAQDYGEAFPRAAGWNDAILPYVKSADVFRCPEGGSQSYYMYSGSLDGGSLRLVAVSSGCAMLADSSRGPGYSGDASAVAFPHHGRASVGAVDGHVTSVTPSELASRFVWDPGATPAVHPWAR